jgi:hypothetical protein
MKGRAPAFMSNSAAAIPLLPVPMTDTLLPPGSFAEAII